MFSISVCRLIHAEILKCLLQHQNSSVVLRLQPCGKVLWETDIVGRLHTLNGVTHL